MQVVQPRFRGIEDGLYPVCPGDSVSALGSSLFGKAVIWQSVGIRYGVGAELEMRNISQSPFPGAFFGLIELVRSKQRFGFVSA
jgi:hypothetical protein